MSEFTDWVQGVKSDLEKKLQQQDLPEEAKKAAYGEASVRIAAAQRVYQCLEAAREIGKTLLPKGDAKDVIELARFVYDIETDIIEIHDEDDGGENDEPNGHRRPQQLPQQIRSRR